MTYASNRSGPFALVRSAVLAAAVGPAVLAAPIPAAAQGPWFMPGGGGSQFGNSLFLGPGSTPGGDLGRGIGIQYSGMGQYREDAARANAINTATGIAANEYVYQSRMEMQRQYAAKVQAEKRRNQDRRDARENRINTMPEEQDIMNGSALNRIVQDLAGYRVAPSMLRSQVTSLPVEMMHGVPYLYPSVGGIISLRRMLPRPEDWPIALRGGSLESRRENYDRAVQDALMLARQGMLSLDEIRAVQGAIKDLRAGMPKLTPGAEQAAFYQAQVFLNQLEATARTLQSSATSVAIAELDGIAGTTVFDLVSFMQRFNLRFASAKTPAERELYKELYHVLATQRNELNEILEPYETAMTLDNFTPPPRVDFTPPLPETPR